VSEGLGERKLSEFSPCPHLSGISRSSDRISLKRDERERNIKKKSRAGEKVEFWSRAFSPRRAMSRLSEIIKEKFWFGFLHISPRRES